MYVLTAVYDFTVSESTVLKAMESCAKDIDTLLEKAGVRFFAAGLLDGKMVEVGLTDSANEEEFMKRATAGPERDRILEAMKAFTTVPADGSHRRRLKLFHTFVR